MSDVSTFSCSAVLRLVCNATVWACLLSHDCHLTAAEPSQSLFDGKTLEGWETRESDRRWWKVDEGLITGGSLTENVPHNMFLATQKSFTNFDLNLKIRILGTTGFINSGVQMRSIRVPDSPEMSGYQVDAGKGWWGKLYDESRRNKVISESANVPAFDKTIQQDAWNEYHIRAEGNRIRSWINGQPALNYVEEDPGIAQDGHIGIQVHGGGQALVQVKDVTITELPATPDAPTWKSLQSASAKISAAPSQAEPKILSAADELAGFHVPEGFTVELVAEESDQVGKFVAVAFDSAGRLWTMTALEYPVDGNENPEESARIFAAGGRDQVLVYDTPFGKPSAPRVFIDGLVMPLGILPYKDGVYVQYGHDIRFYRDTDGDGKADQHEVILTGFGTQDSHLFPHQFTRVPGGSILTAQGLFNYSTVKRGNDLPFTNGQGGVPFNQCKLAAFSFDGSRFDLVASGMNNIWGLTADHTGDIWIQEANDIGIPVTPYVEGSHYRTGSREKLRDYQPTTLATLSPPQMGGTGLSGLALADDRNGWPAPWGRKNAPATEPRHFYLANPITNRLQHVMSTPLGNGHDKFEKQADFLISNDNQFRPVSLQFGPDGCLYFVDWYNKIISHNEVPRNHPERNKTHGRIWRIRHDNQSQTPPPQLAKLSSAELLSFLGADNTRVADLAWQELVDRQASEFVPQLQQIIADDQQAVDRRLGALWALEGLSDLSPQLLNMLSQQPEPALRREAIRIAGASISDEAAFLSIAKPLADDAVPQVRFALENALRKVKFHGPETLSLIIQLGKEPLSGDPHAQYDRDFERYLVRWALEQHPQEVAEFLQSPSGKSLPLENRVLATLSIGGKEAALGLCRLLAELRRPLTEEEIRVLAANATSPEVATALQARLQDPVSQWSILLALLKLRTEINAAALRPEIAAAIRNQWTHQNQADLPVLLEAVGAFQVQQLDVDVATLAAQHEIPRDLRRAAIRALREISTEQLDVLVRIARESTGDPLLQSDALMALADSAHATAFNELITLWPELSFHLRQVVAERLAARRASAEKLIEAVTVGDIDAADLSIAALESMRQLLPENAHVSRLWNQLAGRLQPVLQLSGGAGDYPETSINLEGPFTVETWVRLAPGIDNRDGILGRTGAVDMNFYDGHFRVWNAGTRKDLVIAKTKMIPGTWTHLAVTRDTHGALLIYVNGELNAASTTNDLTTYNGLNIGRTTPGNGGTAGEFTEYRVWNVASPAMEIRNNFDRSFRGEGLPSGLVNLFSGNDWGKLHGQAQVIKALDGPQLLDAAQADRQTQKFAHFRTLSKQSGDLQNGRILFQERCLVCHLQGGQGGKIGPALDGVGNVGIEAILRNVLTPSAAMEGGYRNFRVITRDGRILQGLLVSQDAAAVILRAPSTSDQRIPQSEIDRAEFTPGSVMPEGLLETMTPQQATDLLSYLLSIK